MAKAVTLDPPLAKKRQGTGHPRCGQDKLQDLLYTRVVISSGPPADGKGKFGTAIPIQDTINFQGGYSIAVGDFNNDNAPDIAIPIELKGKVAVLLNAK